MYKVDLHTHSVLSHDGGITAKEYEGILSNRKLDFVAITDHNEIQFAIDLKRKLGSKIIIGEEINTGEGEIIGLFLRKKINPFKRLKDTIDEIKMQGGVVYVPHPFEKPRNGISFDLFNMHLTKFDIVEAHNQRSLKTNNKLGILLRKNEIPSASSSDSHCIYGLGKSHTLLFSPPNESNLIKLVSKAETVKIRASFVERLCPKINKIRKLINA